MKNYLKPFSNSILCKNISIFKFSTSQFNERVNIKACNNLFKKAYLFLDLEMCHVNGTQLYQ